MADTSRPAVSPNPCSHHHCSKAQPSTMLVHNIKNHWFRVQHQLSKNSCETLFWIINVMPTFAGFSFFKKKISALFWVLHLSMNFYTYVIGTVAYNKIYAKDVVDYVNSFLNISILLVITNADCWALFKRSTIQDVLVLVKKNDDLVKDSQRFAKEHEKMLRNIKRIVLGCFAFHFVNDVLIFSTARILAINDIILASCTGLNPLSGSPNLEICKTILTLQEFAAIVVVATYDATLIFLTAHTTAMCELLQVDFDSIKHVSEDQMISNRLQLNINRHAKILQTVKMLQNMYSVTIGVDFGNYALSLLLFFVLPLDICLKFGPLVSHNLMVFFLYCLLGQRLTTAAEKIEVATYNCGWENFSKANRIKVLFILNQSQKPVVLYAAEVVPICIYSFAYAMQMIYKFVTVFKV